jgi:capsular polysaccharide biosynthesis protein
MTDTMLSPHRPDDAPPSHGLLGLWLRRSWGIGTVTAIAGAAIVICTLTALPIVLSQPRVYGAQADLIFNPGADMSDAAADRALVTQEVVLRSRTVLEPVAEATRIPVEGLKKALSVEVVNQSNVVRITVADRDADTARRVAQLIAEEYEKRTLFTTSAADQQPIAYLERQIEQLTASLAGMQARVDRLARRREPDAPMSTEERQLQLLATATQQRLARAQDQLTELQLGRLNQPRSRILAPAQVLEDPLRPRPVQAIAAGALVGVFVAAAIVLVLFRPRFAADRSMWE